MMAIKILHGFIKNGLAKIRLNLQMDKNFKKFQHSASTSVRSRMFSSIRPLAAAECKNTASVIHWYLLTVLKLFDIVLQEISPGYNNGISHFIGRRYSQVAIKKSLQGMLKQKCPGMVAQIVQDKSRHDFQSSLSQMVIGT